MEPDPKKLRGVMENYIIDWNYLKNMIEIGKPVPFQVETYCPRREPIPDKSNKFYQEIIQNLCQDPKYSFKFTLHVWRCNMMIEDEYAIETYKVIVYDIKQNYLEFKNLTEFREHFQKWYSQKDNADSQPFHYSIAFPCDLIKCNCSDEKDCCIQHKIDKYQSTSRNDILTDFVYESIQYTVQSMIDDEFYVNVGIETNHVNGLHSVNIIVSLKQHVINDVDINVQK